MGDMWIHRHTCGLHVDIQGYSGCHVDTLGDMWVTCGYTG